VMLDIERDSMVGTIAAVLLEERVANACHHLAPTAAGPKEYHRGRHRFMASLGLVSIHEFRECIFELCFVFKCLGQPLGEFGEHDTNTTRNI